MIGLNVKGVRAFLLAGIASAALSACASSTPDAGADPSTPPAGGQAPGSAAALYEAGQYREAKAAAEAEAARSSGMLRERALVIAGMSAAALGEDIEAQRILQPLASSSDRAVAGRAKATLGLAAAKRSDYSGASTQLIEASRLLSGDESANASLHAGDALVRLNRPERARVQYQIGVASAQSPELKRVLQSRADGSSAATGSAGTGGSFSIQIGAFTSKANADRAAADARGRASAAGLAPPRVVPGVDSRGRQVHYVYIGQFGSRQAAVAARTKLGQGILVQPGS